VRFKAWNEPIHSIRGRIEKIFRTWKRSYGLRRMPWRGLAKASLQIRFTAIVYNMKRCSRILACPGGAPRRLQKTGVIAAHLSGPSILWKPIESQKSTHRSPRSEAKRDPPIADERTGMRALPGQRHRHHDPRLRRAEFKNSEFVATRDGVGDVDRVHLRFEHIDVGVDGSVGDAEDCRRLPIGFAFGGPREDFQLAGREGSTFHWS
jgi:hypothetical protein